MCENKNITALEEEKLSDGMNGIGCRLNVALWYPGIKRSEYPGANSYGTVPSGATDLSVYSKANFLLQNGQGRVASAVG